GPMWPGEKPFSRCLSLPSSSRLRSYWAPKVPEDRQTLGGSLPILALIGTYFGTTHCSGSNHGVPRFGSWCTDHCSCSVRCSCFHYSEARASAARGAV